MADAASIIVAVGGITVANDVIFNGQSVPWKTVIATGIGAMIFAGAQSAVGEPAVMLAWLALVGALLYTPKTGKSFSANLANWAKGN